MNAKMYRILMLAAVAAAAMLCAAIWSSPAQAQGQEGTGETPTECTALDADAQAALAAAVAPRGNLSRHNQSVFIEWKIVHNSDATDLTAPGLGGTDRVLREGKPELFVNNAAPAQFVVQRSTDGEFGAPTDLKTIGNESDRYATNIEDWKVEFQARTGRAPTELEIALQLHTLLEHVSTKGRQLYHYDSTIVWPPRYPGHTYQYRVVVVYNENCGVPLEITYPSDRDGVEQDGILVQDSTPTTCTEGYSATALKNLLHPISGVDDDGRLFVMWNHVRRDGPEYVPVTREITWTDARGVERSTDITVYEQRDYVNTAHAAASPLQDSSVLPRYVIQRYAGSDDDGAYYETVANWANDGRGRALKWSYDGAHTYRLVVVYGPACGVAMEFDLPEIPDIDCEGDQRSKTLPLYRAMKPRRALDEQQGVIITWKSIPRGVDGPDGAYSDYPRRLALQRKSDETPEWETLATFRNDERGRNMRYVDATALPGDTYTYRLVIVYSGGCAVAPRDLKPLPVPAHRAVGADRLIESVTYVAGRGVRVQFNQVYWAGTYQVHRQTSRTGSGFDDWTTVRALAHKDGRATNRYLDTTLRQSDSGNIDSICYAVQAFYPDSSSPLERTQVQDNHSVCLPAQGDTYELQ